MVSTEDSAGPGAVSAAGSVPAMWLTSQQDMPPACADGAAEDVNGWRASATSIHASGTGAGIIAQPLMGLFALLHVGVGSLHALLET